MFLFPAKFLFVQRYSRQKVVVGVNSGYDSLATHCIIDILEKLLRMMNSECRLISRLSLVSRTAN